MSEGAVSDFEWWRWFDQSSHAMVHSLRLVGQKMAV